MTPISIEFFEDVPCDRVFVVDGYIQSAFSRLRNDFGVDTCIYQQMNQLGIATDGGFVKGGTACGAEVADDDSMLQ